jgi:hypothetical protein
MGGGVHEETVASGHGVGGRMGLLRGKGAVDGQEARVNGTAVVEKVSYRYL